MSLPSGPVLLSHWLLLSGSCQGAPTKWPYPVTHTQWPLLSGPSKWPLPSDSYQVAPTKVLSNPCQVAAAKWHLPNQLYPLAPTK